MIGWLFRGRDRETFPYRPKAVREADNDIPFSPHWEYVVNGERPAIVDDDGMTYSDWDYVKTGISEGWLRHIGWHWEGPILIQRYRLIE